MSSHWLNPKNVAKMTGVNARFWRRIAAGEKTWRGFQLNCRCVHGKGGRSGLQWEIEVLSLPLDIQQRLQADITPFEGALNHSPKAQSQRDLWFNLSAPIITHPKASNARGAAINHLMANPPLGADGKPMILSIRTIQRRLARYETPGGYGALARGRRRDAGKRRVIVFLAYDTAARAAGADDGQLNKIGDGFRQCIRGYIAKGIQPAVIQQIGKVWLMTETGRQGIALGGDVVLAAACDFPAYLIKKERVYRKMATFTRDRKAYEDAKPRIRRTRAGLAQPWMSVPCVPAGKELQPQ